MKSYDSVSDKKVKSLIEDDYEYELPEDNGEFWSSKSYKDGYKINGKQAKLGKGRVDYLLLSNGTNNKNSDYAKAYITYINPKDFLRLTASNPDEDEYKNQKLDLEKLNNESQTPFLDIDFDNNVVTGHEGRHRLSALANAGVESVPIVVRNTSKSFKKNDTAPMRYRNKIKGQSWYGDSDEVIKAQDTNLDLDLTPLNYKNANAIYKKFIK